MRKRDFMCLAAGLLVTCLVVLAALVGKSRSKLGPKFEGRTASQWVTQLIRDPVQAGDALRKLSPGSVTALSAAIEEREGWLDRLLLRHRTRLPSFARKQTLLPNEVEIRQQRAMQVLSDLGIEAAPAIPALLHFASEPGTSEWNRMMAHSLILKVGEAGVPFLIKVLGARETRVREQAARYLALVGSKEDERVVRAFADMLSDGNSGIRISAVETLARMGPSAVASLPQLRKALRKGDESFQLKAADALWNVGGECEPSIPMLITVLENQESPNRAHAASILASMGPKAAPAAPALARLTAEEFSYTRVKAEEALQAMSINHPAPPSSPP